MTPSARGPLLQAHDALGDPFGEPYVDVDELRDMPVKHRYLHGGFAGTETRFSLYLPPADRYEGRFFQYVTPIPDSEFLCQGGVGEEDKIGLAVSSGAYLIETNGGGGGLFGDPSDPLISAYKANAAVAVHSRTIAADIYGPHRPYGYCFGGSGGGFRTIGGVESTEIWDGSVPFVVGSPASIPSAFSVRMMAMRVLNDKLPQIVDALEPGGSGDMFAGLNDRESAALSEVTSMGFPPQSWFGHRTMGVHGFTAVYPGLVAADPSYFEHDFWSVPGHLGADAPEEFVGARLQHSSRIKALISAEGAVASAFVVPGAERERGTADAAWKGGETQKGLPAAVQLEDVMPDVGFLGGDLRVTSGEAAGATLQLVALAGDHATLGPADAAVLELLRPGDHVVVDNSNFLAAQTYHRHQDPGSDFLGWDQFRDVDGASLYPQRPMLLGPMFLQRAAGTIPSGRFHGKMIMVDALWDREAFPWQGDWYRRQVAKHFGDLVDDRFRLWYVDRALHADSQDQEDNGRTVSYLGVLHQALRDLSAWVERDVAPPSSTAYVIDNAQVRIPADAKARGGIQPVVTLLVNGGEQAVVAVGDAVELSVAAEMPAGAGLIVAVEWQFDCDDARVQDAGEVHVPCDALSLTATCSFVRPGTYFPSVVVSSERDGDLEAVFARIKNLGRARVVVT